MEAMEKDSANTGFKIKMKLDKEKFSSYVRAIEPDLRTSVGRSRTWLEVDYMNFFIYIWSPETVSQRAALGSIIRWFKVVKDMLEVVD